MDSFDAEIDAVFLSSGDYERRQEGGKSGCLTPISVGNDLSMIANKGSMSLSIDEIDIDEDEATLSAATTPLLSEACYCCPTHAEINVVQSVNDTKLDAGRMKCKVKHQNMRDHVSIGATNNFIIILPLPQKQFSDDLCIEQDKEQCKEISALHASINIPASDTGYTKQHTRLRKFETITQSTSNSNFPFESNTLKRVPNIVKEFDDATMYTQSCINLKSDSVQDAANFPIGNSRQHKNIGSLSVQTQKPKNLSSNIAREEDCAEVPENITHGFHGKTQSMDSEQFFNEFILMPANSPTDLHPYLEHK